MEDVYGLEINGAQIIKDSNTIMRKELIILPSSLHFQELLNGFQVGPNIPIYMFVLINWYYGHIDPTHVKENDPIPL